MTKKHHGTSLDSLLEEEGVFEETQAMAIEEVVAWQLTEGMEPPVHPEPVQGPPITRSP